MVNTLDEAATAVLHEAVAGRDGATGVPGVVAVATNRDGTIYAGAAGKRVLPDGEDMTTDTVFAIFSCTKAITGTALMQAVEDGLLALDDPAKKYVPYIAELQVLEGFDGDKPRTRAPKSDITVRQLMLHTAGCGYDFFSEGILKYNAFAGVPSVISGTRKSIKNVLLFDPGERWEYGSNIDWVGLVVEAVRGQRLGDVFAERIFAPLEINDMSFTLSPAMRPRLATIHQREPNGSFTPLAGFELPQDPELQMGGHALYGSLGEYAKFIRMYLNDGEGPAGRVLRRETIAEMERNGLGSLKVTMLPGVIPTLSNDAEFFPGMPKSWGLTFMINDVDAPTGRPAGALAWAGLANLFFWIDRKSGIGGMWGTQILPFADGVSVPGYYAFEKAVYDSIR